MVLEAWPKPDPLRRRPRILVPDVVEESDFGPNPGHLRLLRYVPPRLKRGAPLVVVLHGCGQTAAGYGLGAGWFQLAAEYGFAVLSPEQRAINNPNTCFNWFQPIDTARDSGEVASIRRMIGFMLDRYGLDASRIFITGLSAGGAMTAAMLAAYPDVFAGGAIVAGLPVGAAQNVREALEAMKQPPRKDARVWGDAVRRASSHAGRWPIVAIWHGTGDDIVHPDNALASVAQWADLHDVAHAQDEHRPGHHVRRWRDGTGRLVLESHSLAGLGHGVPIASLQGHGIPAPFILEANIASSLHIARFWGIADDGGPHTMTDLHDVAEPSSSPDTGPAAREDEDVIAPAPPTLAARLRQWLGRWL